MMKKKKFLWRVFLYMLLGLAAIALVLCLVYSKAAFAIYKNLTVPKYKLETDMDWTGGQSYEHVPYAEASESQYVDIYVPSAADGTIPKLFVIIHGGGFVSNDSQSRQAMLMFRYFRDHGYACASVNYRLAQEAAFPAAVEDCKAAIRFLRAHAAEYGFDAEKIAVFGESAGGYLAEMCAFTNEEEFSTLSFIGQDETEKISAHVDLLVDYYGHTENGTHDDDWKALGIPRVVVRLASSWLDHSLIEGYESFDSYWMRKNISEMSKEEFDATDIYTYLKKNDLTDLSAWLIHGDCDITVPVVESERLFAALQEKDGIGEVEFQVVHGMGHASDPLYSDELLSQLKDFMDRNLG